MKAKCLMIQGTASSVGQSLNMGMAEIADAPVILVGDIDKGGYNRLELQ